VALGGSSVSSTSRRSTHGSRPGTGWHRRPIVDAASLTFNWHSSGHLARATPGERIEQLLALNEGSLVRRHSGRSRSRTPTAPMAWTSISIRRRSRPPSLATSTRRPQASWQPPSARGVLRRSARRPGRRRGSRSPPFIYSAPRTGRPSGDAALHGRARNGDNRAGPGLPRLHGFAATRRDESDRQGGQRDGRRDRAGVAPKVEPEGPPAQTPRDRAWQRWAWRAVLAPLGCGHVRRCEPDP
jgi:hypothetical protein